MYSLSTCFWSLVNKSYLSLNFSNNTLYVRVLTSLSYVENSSSTVCFESWVISFLVKCSSKVTLLPTNWVGLEIDFELIFSIKVYKAANSL